MDLGSGVIELRECKSSLLNTEEQADSKVSSRWLVIKESFHPTNKRGDIDVAETEVSIALSLDEADAGTLPRFQDTYAYLPCCQSGLRFMVNAGWLEILMIGQTLMLCSHCRLHCPGRTRVNLIGQPVEL